MAARFAVVSGRSNGRRKCEYLEKIAFRKKQKSYEIWFIKILRVNIKLYVLYLDKNWLRGRAIHVAVCEI